MGRAAAGARADVSLYELPLLGAAGSGKQSDQSDDFRVDSSEGGLIPVQADAIRRARPVCRSCNRRPALACVRGAWRVVKHHDVCRQCWRSMTDSRRAGRLAALERERSASGRTSRPSRARWGGGTDCRARARP